MTQLTEHFSLEELSVTLHREIDNTPPLHIVKKLKFLAQCMEQVRVVLGKPVIIHSGYRCDALNKLVGGAPNSQHLTGEACDFTVPAFGTPYEVCCAIEASDLRFDQMIYEGSWVHLSFIEWRHLGFVEYRPPRRSILTWRKGLGYDQGLLPG